MTQNRVGVIGWPVEHSLSPVMHNAAFAALAMHDWHYDRVPLPPDIVRQGLRTLKEEGGYIGVNVTVPLKQAVMPYVRPDERAQAIGAVNTIVFHGYKATNTDVTGFIADLTAHDVPVAGEKVVILGAGGAARSAVYGLAQAGAQLAVVNRMPERARQMLADLNIAAGIMTAEEAAEWQPSLLVNCTPVGLWPHVDAVAWPSDAAFPQGVTVYDMIYRPARTRLMELAELRGGRAINGLGMLVRQGAEAFKIWTGVEPPLDVMFDALETALREQTG